MAERFINIKFPFSDSQKGYFLDMNKTSADAIKSDLVHLLLTNKGERLYLPDFGTNLKRHLFEPNDAKTQNDIKREIQAAVSKYIPNLQINEVSVTNTDRSEHAALVRVDYTVTNDAFQRSDFVEIEV